MKNDTLDNARRALAPLWNDVKELFEEQHFLTIICGFFLVVMVIHFYRFLRSISPALVVIVMLLAISILMLHWTQTRTEPRFLRPLVDAVAPYVGAPKYTP